MKLLDADISNSVYCFFRSKADALKSLEEANDLMQNECGIRIFFVDETELSYIVEELNEAKFSETYESNAEYGDFQTNQILTVQIAKKLKADGVSPKVVVEPTCGKGHFILATLHAFDKIEKVYGVEIQKKYTWQAKFNILDFFLNNSYEIKPEIHIIHSSIFDFDYHSIKEVIGEKELLIIGNPPWVTNSELSAMDSKNLPKKSNFKRHKGLDAMTGKGNFDIAEYITIDLLRNFGRCMGNMAILPIHLPKFLNKSIVMYSAMSKLPFPVIASSPLWRLKFDFLGKFLESIALNSEFVTHGGLPIISNSFSPITSFIE